VAAPFATDAMLSFLATHSVPGVEFVRGRTYFRSLRLPSGAGTVAVTLPETGQTNHHTPPAGPRITARFRLDDPADLPVATAHCRRLLDLDADPHRIDATLAADPALAAAVRATPGVRVPGAVDGPEMLIRAMLGQQVSVAGAQTAAARLVVAADDRLPTPADDRVPTPDDDLTHLFPTARAIADLGPGLIAGPRRRAQAVCDVAAAMADGSLLVDAGRTTADLTTALIARPGIGPWTAGYVAMRLLGDPDVLLTGDLVLRNGAALLGLPATRAALTTRAKAWQPFRSYAGMHLWRTALAGRGRLDSGS